MHHSRYTPRRALRLAFALGAAGAASLALAGVAGAAVIPITPDGNSGTDHLGAAITQANTNSATSNTIVLAPGVYTLGASTTAPPFTITKNLTIVGDHSLQCNGGVPGGTPCIEINGASAFTAHGNNDLIHVNPGVTLTVEGTNIDSAGGTGFSAIVDNGTVNMWGVEMDGDPGFALTVPAGGVATLNESAVDGDLADSFSDSGSLTLNNVTIANNTGDAVDTGPQGTYVLNMTNTALVNNSTLINCSPSASAGGGVTNGGPGSIADDSSCGVASQGQTGLDSLTFGSATNGGPGTSMNPGANTLTTNKGVNCPIVDQRFYVNPVVSGTRECDIGAVTSGATQETAAPACVVTSTNEGGTPPTQQVSVSDSASGIGPEPGAGTDNPTNTLATAYPPPAAVPIPGYAISNLQISNGSVAFTPFSSPSTSPLVLTASKTTVGTTTHWSFTGLNWAGVSKNCF